MFRLPGSGGRRLSIAEWAYVMIWCVENDVCEQSFIGRSLRRSFQQVYMINIPLFALIGLLDFVINIDDALIDLVGALPSGVQFVISSWQSLKIYKDYISEVERARFGVLVVPFFSLR